MLIRLAQEHRRILDGGSCCIVFCAADEVAGLTPELVLAEAADRFARVLRAHDAIFRYGEDRLLLCLPHIKSADGSRVMARLRRLVCDRPVSLPGGGTASISVTLGGAMMNRVDMVEETAARAERSLKSGRGVGGNCVCMWAPEAM
jgi:GGDEF domain-containing protein